MGAALGDILGALWKLLEISWGSLEVSRAALGGILGGVLGALQMVGGLGMKVAGEICVGRPAVAPVLSRKGTGKLRRIRVNMLWVKHLTVL